jgi:hypothetical protein
MYGGYVFPTCNKEGSGFDSPCVSQKMKVNPLKGLILLGLQRNYLPENFKIKSYEYVR